MNKNLTVVLFVLSVSILACSSSSKKDKLKGDKSENQTIQNNKAETTLSEKKKLLMALKGDHKLKNITVNMGANTYVDYSIENEKWKAVESDWSMRNNDEGSYKVRLSGSSIRKLESTKIIVNDDLSISVLCEDKTYFSIPFDEKGMAYKFSKSPITYSLNEVVKPESIIVDSVLYLMGRDKVSHKEVSFTDYVGIDVGIVLLTYDMRQKSFSFDAKYEECCDGASFIFQ